MGRLAVVVIVVVVVVVIAVVVVVGFALETDVSDAAGR